MYLIMKTIDQQDTYLQFYHAESACDDYKKQLREFDEYFGSRSTQGGQILQT